MAAIHYEKGQVLGPYGVIYLKEAEAHITPGGSRQRQAYFQCPYDGKIFISRIQDVKQGKVRSCGCYHSQLNHDLFFKDISGQRYGQLTVLYHLPDDCNKWVCKCDCGKIVAVSRGNLTSGNSTSCGCKRIKTLIDTKLKNISGQKFGKLTALFPVNNSGKRIWHCICDCGNFTDVQIDCLTTGNTTSCGCQKSKGEELVAHLLTDMHISFIKQYKFDACVNPDSNFKLPFDFYLPTYNCCIEYDGIQHFIPIEAWGGEEAFYKTQKRDNIKTLFCINNKVQLIRIPYTDYKLLDKQYLYNKLEQKGE